MKALVYTGAKSMVFQDVPAPARGSGENLIKIDSVGICGSDMHAYLGHDERRPAPLILGHEAAGIVEAGDLEGRRVTVNPLVSCGQCPACREGRSNICPDRKIISMPPREGAFAEYLVMQSENLIEVPAETPLYAAALVEPLAVCWHAVRLADEALFSDLSMVRHLVIGGGAIGYGSALALRIFGAKDVVIAEANADRRSHLESLGDFPIIDPSDANPSAFELVVDAVGIAPTRQLASRAATPGGVICHIGLGDSEGGLDIRRMTLQEITFIGTYTYTKADFQDAAAAIFDKRFGNLNWITRRPLMSGADAFAEILAGKVLAPKTILHP